MRRSGDRPFSIVVGFDFSELGKLALAEALGLASLNQRTVLHILGVLDASEGLGPVRPERKSDDETTEQVQAEIKVVLEETIQKYDPSRFRFYIHARIGEPAEEIIRLADEAHADLIVIGTHGRSGIERLLLGSVSERVVRHAGCPVLVMRPKREPADADEDDEAYQPEARVRALRRAPARDRRRRVVVRRARPDLRASAPLLVLDQHRPDRAGRLDDFQQVAMQPRSMQRPLHPPWRQW